MEDWWSDVLFKTVAFTCLRIDVKEGPVQPLASGDRLWGDFAVHPPQKSIQHLGNRWR